MPRRTIAVAVAMAAAAGCSANRSSVEILGRAAPDNVPSCKFASGGDVLAGPGQFDLGAAIRTYQTVLYVNNTMTDPSAANSSTVSAAKAWRALAAKIRVNPSDYLSSFPPSPSLLPFSAETRMPLDGTTIEVNTKGVVHVSVASQPLGDALLAAMGGATRAMVVVGVTLEGETLDGSSLDSGEFYFALDVCNGGCYTPICKTGQVVVSCFGVGGAADDPMGCAAP